MSNLIQGLAFALFSTADFGDRVLARKIVSVFESDFPSVRPRKFGAFQPSESFKHIDSVVELLVNQTGASCGPSAGSLILESSKDCGFQVQWNKSDIPSFSYIGGHLMFSAIAKDSRLLDEFVGLFRALVGLVKPVYGEVRSMADKGWDAPVNLQLRLPDVPSIFIYGAEYIEFFGREKIETVPGCRIERSQDFYWIEAHKNLCEGVPDETRARIREHLGTNSFMANGKWKYASGEAPPFDMHRLVVSPD